jgi:hypothetical protein
MLGGERLMPFDGSPISKIYVPWDSVTAYKNASYWNEFDIEGYNFDGEESGGSLTFPVTLVEGDNGQLGIDVYNYFITKYTDEDEIEESLFVSINGVTKQLNIVYRILSDYNTIVFTSDNDYSQGTFSGVSYFLRNTGNLEYSDPSSQY